MASLKEVRGRINSVQSTQQITKAMKMVAAAKLRRAQDAIIQMRPYAQKLEEVLANVSSTMDSVEDNVYGAKRDTLKRALIIVITSDKGLCGGFNSTILKHTVSHIEEKYAALKANNNLDILCIGKKGTEFFQRRDYRVIDTYKDTLLHLSFDEVQKAAEFAMGRFEKGTYDIVDVAYNEFKNVATQIPRVEQFLPIQEKEIDQKEVVEASLVDYIYEPDMAFIVNDLIPKSLKIKLYKSVLESNAAEQGARMTAMDKATDNAGELLKDLKLIYNRTRQAAITTEILEIVGGAEALASGN